MVLYLKRNMAQKQTASLSEIKSQVLEALAHPEADEGLYFSNLYILHEEDERPRVSGSPIDIGKAIDELASEGKVTIDDSGAEAVVMLISK